MGMVRYHRVDMRDPVVREFLLAFWKIDILHHAAEHGVYGQWMLDELHHHGYRLSPRHAVSDARADGGARLAARVGHQAVEGGSHAPADRPRPRGAERVRESLAELYREVGDPRLGARTPEL